MKNTALFFLLGLILISNSYSQQKTYGYKTLGSTDIVSDIFFVQEGYKLDSLVYQTTYDKLYKFGYYPNGKLKWDYNYMIFQEVRNKRPVSFPAYRIYYYNENGEISSTNYYYWNGIVWIDKGGERYVYSYDDNGNTLVKESIGINNETTTRVEENTYDSNGNLTQKKITLMATSYPTYNIWEYDSLGRLILKKSFVDSPNLSWDQYIYEYPENGNINCTKQFVYSDSQTPVTNKANYLMEFDEDGKLINQQLSGSFDISDSTWKNITNIPFSYDDKGKAINIGSPNRVHYNSVGNVDSLIILYGSSGAGYLVLRAELMDSYGNKITPVDIHGISLLYYSELTPETEKELLVTSMNNTDNLIAGDITEITWQSNNVDEVTIAFSPDSGATWSLVAENINASDGSYSWLVPVTESNECLIRVSDPNTMNLYDECDNLFTIKQSVGIEDEEIPTKYTLFQNYPNPFNPTTTICYELPEKSFVSLRIFDAMGEEVAVLVNSEKSAGKYNIKLDGSMLSSGIYFYQMKAGDFFQTKKFILLK